MREINILRWCVTLGIGFLVASTIAACFPEAERGNSSIATITILGTNDFHGALLPEGANGGLPVFSGYVNNIRMLRAADGGAVALIDAGDMWQGSLESNLNEGQPVLQAYDALRYDAVTIGNHEFDYGPAGPRATPASDTDDAQGALRARAAEASFPFLAANLIEIDTGLPVDWINVSPSIQIEKSGISIGIVGILTEHALSTTITANVRNLRVAPLLSSVRQEAAKLRQNGADIVVVTAHAGGTCMQFGKPDDLSSCNLNGEIFRLAANLPAGLVDVIIGGHVHKGIAHDINGISVISSFSNGAAFGRVDLIFDREKSRITDRTVYAPQRICEFDIGSDNMCGRASDGALQTSYAGSLVRRDPVIEKIVSRAVADVKQFKEREIGVLVEADFPKAANAESPIGNLMTDIMLEMSDGADVAIHNNVGGIRAGIPAGDLTFGDIYETFPFDNLLVTLSIDGAALKRVFSVQLQSGQWRVGMAGLDLIAECQGSSLDITLVRKDGRVVRDEEVLIVATTDFLATGGDAILSPIMPDDGFPFSADSPLYRDTIVEWMERRGGTLRPSDFHDPSNPRFAFLGEAAQSCEAEVGADRS